KTTLIKTIEGLLSPASGEVLIDGERPGIDTKAEVSYLPDRNFLPLHFTVDGVLGFYSDFFEDFSQKRAEDMIDQLGLDRKQRLKSMSKGTLEKLHLIITMSRRAKVYLLDEPIGGVDPAARDYILNTILSSYSKDVLILISTHLIADVEQILDDIVFMRDGKITLHESADSLREKRGMSVDGVFREEFRC
ncbi:MAG: ATP-binding cassette domain-containing protein, partial [Anaerovoracaceae bacterium]